jgi:hypothetical protein
VSDADDHVPDPIANFDQALRGLKDLARVMMTYQRELVGQGFPPAEALVIVCAYQQQLCQQGSNDADS